MLIDTHVHCVPFSIRDEFSRRGLSAIFRQFPANEMKEAVENLLLDMGQAGVDSSLVVTSGNLDIFEQYAGTHARKLFVAYIYDSRNSKDGLRHLRKAVDRHSQLIKCVKTMFPYLNQHPMQREFFPMYRYCEERELPIQFHMGGDPRMEQLSHLVYFGKLCSLFPKLKVVCLHAGGGQVGTIPLLVNLWENVFVELEGLQLPEAEGTREPGVLRYLLTQVGSHRLMFGSDRIFPEEKYFARVQAVRSVEHEYVEDVSWRTANRVFELGIKM